MHAIPIGLSSPKSHAADRLPTRAITRERDQQISAGMAFLRPADGQVGSYLSLPGRHRPTRFRHRSSGNPGQGSSTKERTGTAWEPTTRRATRPRSSRDRPRKDSGGPPTTRNWRPKAEPTRPRATSSKPARRSRTPSNADQAPLLLDFPAATTNSSAPAWEVTGIGRAPAVPEP